MANHTEQRESPAPTPEEHELIEAPEDGRKEQIGEIARAPVDRTYDGAVDTGAQTLFREIAENGPGVIWIAHRETRRIVYESPACRALWGSSSRSAREELDGLLERVYPEDRSELLAILDSPEENQEIEVRVHLEDGSTRWIRSCLVPLRGQSGKNERLVSVAFDITERKHLIDKLRAQEGLRRLGELVSVVAHDLKAPLSSAITGLEFIQRHLPAESTAETIARELAANMESLLKRTNEMLLLGRPQAPEFERLELKEAAERAAGLFGRDSRFDHVVVRVEGSQARVIADGKQIERVFLNLLENAAQAMGGRGEVAVRIEKREGCCHVSVSDSGPGVPPTIADKLFEPFFTTKDRGTGLGLALCKRIVEDHGGRIYWDRDAPSGATIAIELPRSSSAAKRQAPRKLAEG